jgi:SAM-dependent methyltransferase
LEQQAKEYKSCLISGSTDLRPIKGYEKFHLVRSHPVGFVFSNRIPTAEELEENYSGYKPKKYFSPVTKARYEELLDDFSKYNKNNRIHDVGCGSCLFLSVARERKWDATGNEVSDVAVNACKERGVDIINGEFDPSWFPEGSIDVITAFEVLEHLSDPLDEIRKIHRALRKGGLFFFTTPNFNALERMVLRSDYNILSYPDHLAYYTPRTVDYLMQKCGFTKLKLQTTGFSITRITTSWQMKKTGERNFDLASSETSDEKIRKALQSNIGSVMKNIMNTGLTAFGIGNSLKGWYIKD